MGGDHAILPTAEMLAQLLAETEVRLLLNQSGTAAALSDTAWYLHGIASNLSAVAIYGFPRQRAAFRVAGHIFDLLLQDESLSLPDQLAYAFASQIAYMRSELNPNSAAVYRREFAGSLPAPDLESEPILCALCFGVALLGMDIRYIFDSFRRLRDQVNDISTRWQVESINETPYAAAAGVGYAARDILSFLMYGNENSLRRSRESLLVALRAVASDNDRTSRWIGAHLLQMGGDFEHTSIWKALPPEIPPVVKKAFSLTTPRVLTLWPPQVDTFRASGPDEIHPLTPDSKRLFLSTPTSGGKTLTAQILIASHLATQFTGVCYIAPTRSLCYEVKRALDSRLKNIGARVIADLPEWGEILDSVEFEKQVEVMTPERLSYLLRSGPSEVLRRFGLFIFDEIHNVSDGSRGWTLEALVSYIHSETMASEHRIVLMSAVVGNRNHFAVWMEREGTPALMKHSDWRGPRRIHCIWTTSADWTEARWEKTRSKKSPRRQMVPLRGVLHVRVGASGAIRNLSTTEYMGELALDEDLHGKRTKNSAASTSFIRTLLPLIAHLGSLGPVLVIEATRPATVRLAKAIAVARAEAVGAKALRHLLDMIETRLGREHPLYECVRKGVAYHHGSLPAEIRFGIEEAVTDGLLDCLVATTTMTEGVNLPVRSVVIASQGFHNADGYSEYISGSKLVNAIGRAGRAAKETEGVVVLARAAEYSRKDFDRLTPSDDATAVHSWLVTTEALEALASFEELQRSGADAVIETAAGPVADFVSFVWFLAGGAEQDDLAPDVDKVQRVLSRTLAWKQLSTEQQRRWIAASATALQTFSQIEPRARRRWGRSGASIGSAQRIEYIAQELAREISVEERPAHTRGILELIFDQGRLGRLLNLAEAPRRVAYDRRAGNRTQISIELDSFLLDWVGGEELSTLANRYFGDVADTEFRFEQLGDFINDYFQVFLPWVTSILVAWTNELLGEDNPHRIPTAIPAYIRWGIADPTALNLMSHGIRSRRLAAAIARRLVSTGGDNVKQWLQSLTIGDWREQFEASVPELRNLLEFASDRGRSIGATLLEGSPVELDFHSSVQDFGQSSASLLTEDEEELSPVFIRTAEGLDVGYIPLRYLDEVLGWIRSGLEIRVSARAENGLGIVTIELTADEEY